MELHEEEWARKGATLSDRTARSEFGLTQDEIIAAIDSGHLQYRPASIHGNPWLRLLRREVEELVRTRQGERYLRERIAMAKSNRQKKQDRAKAEARRAEQLRLRAKAERQQEAAEHYSRLFDPRTSPAEVAELRTPSAPDRGDARRGRGSRRGVQPVKLQLVKLYRYP